MAMVNPLKAGVTFGALLGGYHFCWSLLVALGWAQPLIDFVFWMHLIQPVFVIRPAGRRRSHRLYIDSRVRHRVSLRRGMEQAAPLSGARVELCYSRRGCGWTVTRRPNSAEILPPIRPWTVAAQQSGLWSRIHIRTSCNAKNALFRLHACFPTTQAMSELFRNAGISADVLRLLTWGPPFCRMHCKTIRLHLP
jgi:hypothetical protein